MQISRRQFMALSAASITCGGLETLTAASKKTKRVIFIAGKASHSYGIHEHIAGCRLLADRLNQLKTITAEVVEGQWPDDSDLLKKADAIVIFGDGDNSNPIKGHESQITQLAQKGSGLGFIHYALTPPDPDRQPIQEAIGGYYKIHWSVNPMWTAHFKKLVKHPVTRGVRPFDIKDEWYYHMRFVPNMTGVTPVLSDLPPADTLKRIDGPHSNNPHVRKAVLEDKHPQHTAWVYARPGGGRGFGFTGGHYHWNWAHDDYRKLALNAIVWLTGLEIPPGGIASQTPDYNELTKPLGKPPRNFNDNAMKQLMQKWAAQ